MVLPQLQHEGWISPGYVVWGLVRESHTNLHNIKRELVQGKAPQEPKDQ
jgi:hypothetical protein